MTREERMSTLALAEASELDQLLASLGQEPAFRWIREPAYGTVMVRGNMHGANRAFNLGEAVVTSCSLQLLSGNVVGLSYIVGRRRRSATIAALLDAIAQLDDDNGVLTRSQIEEIRAARSVRKAATRSKISSTEVDFSMLLRREAE
jgi:alpha-D-ribose 1-methylphosphonate 5-triphosphate synthase subunit PhnG